MPQIGDISIDKKPRGRPKCNHPSQLWIICPVCGKGRWLEWGHVKADNFTGKCQGCVDRSGENHPRWKGGQYINSNGYVMVKRYGHPHADAQGYVKRSRIVLERKLGRPLLEGHVPHHRNEIKDDDRPENLLEILHGQHQSLHRKLRKWNTVFGNNGNWFIFCDEPIPIFTEGEPEPKPEP